jgi:hypothetical protein
MVGDCGVGLAATTATGVRPLESSMTCGISSVDLDRVNLRGGGSSILVKLLTNNYYKLFVSEFSALWMSELRRYAVGKSIHYSVGRGL